MNTEDVICLIAEMRERLDLLERAATGVDPNHERDFCRLVRVVAQEFGLSAVVMMSGSRSQMVYRARATAMWLTRARKRGLSYPDIGARFGKHYSTVIYARGQVEYWMRSEPRYRARVEALQERLDRMEEAA